MLVATFFLKLISIDMVSILCVETLLRNVDKLSPWNYNKSLLPFKPQSNLFGMQNSFNLICPEKKESSSLVSKMSNMSVWKMKDDASNLFLTELVFKWQTIIFSELHFCTSNFCINRSVLSNEVRTILFWLMKLSSSQSTHTPLSELTLFIFIE